MIVLYDYPECPYAQKVRVVLAEKDLEYERKIIDLKRNEQRTAEFLKLNPLGKVPVLVDEDVVVYDSTIINEYLDEEYLNQPLMPQEDSAARARVRMMEDLADTLFTPRVELIIGELRKGEADRDQDRVKRLQGEILQLLRRLEVPLGQTPFVAGEFSLADVAFVPGVLLLDQVGVEVDPSLPNVRRWISALQSRNSVRALRE